MVNLLACWCYRLPPSISQLQLLVTQCEGRLRYREPNFLNLMLVTELEEFFIYRKDFLVHQYLVLETWEEKQTFEHSFGSRLPVDYWTSLNLEPSPAL